MLIKDVTDSYHNASESNISDFSMLFIFHIYHKADVVSSQQLCIFVSLVFPCSSSHKPFPLINWDHIHPTLDAIHNLHTATAQGNR